MRNYKFGMTQRVFESIMESSKEQLIKRSELLKKEIDLGLLVGIKWSKELELINSTIKSL